MVVDIADQFVHRVLLDSGAKVNVISKSCWDQMDLEDKVLKRSSTPIVGISRESIQAEGKITLPVTITDKQGVTITVPRYLMSLMLLPDTTIFWEESLLWQ